MNTHIERIIIGGSAGSLEQLLILFSYTQERKLPPVIYACHMLDGEDVMHLKDSLASNLPIAVNIAEPNQTLMAGNLYITPGKYHLILEEQGNVCRYYDDEPYNCSKPSIDLLLFSCCGIEAQTTCAFLLSGANNDGAAGFAKLANLGATCLVADPEQSLFPMMPQSALKAVPDAHIIDVEAKSSWLERVL
jgi:two-component system, chemotaxis family, protein-glutamate methylesterase/glutaminase